MISTVLSSSSLSWLVGEFFVSIVAISGGVLVFRGLWIENKADKDEFLDVDDFRSSKLRKKHGWKMLMWGIALETAVAGVFAARDGWEWPAQRCVVRSGLHPAALCAWLASWSWFLPCRNHSPNLMREEIKNQTDPLPNFARSCQTTHIQAILRLD
jgi:hypothetical protein